MIGGNSLKPAVPRIGCGGLFFGILPQVSYICKLEVEGLICKYMMFTHLPSKIVEAAEKYR